MTSQSLNLACMPLSLGFRYSTAAEIDDVLQVHGNAGLGLLVCEDR